MTCCSLWHAGHRGLINFRHDGTYLGLSDTPSSFTAGALPFVNATGDALTDSSDLTFTSGQLTVGSAPALSRVTIGGDLSLAAQGALRFYTADNSQFVGFQASSSLASSQIWTLPPDDGSSNTVLTTDGNGNLRFESVTAIGGGASTYLDLTDTPASYLAGALPFANASSTGLSQSSNLIFDGTNFAIGAITSPARLTVDGDATFYNDDASVGVVFDAASEALGIGTDSTFGKLSVNAGSIVQRSGAVTDVYEPRIVETITTPGTVNDLTVVGQYLYSVSTASGDDFHVVNVRNPQNAVAMSSLNLPADARGVEGRLRTW